MTLCLVQPARLKYCTARSCFSAAAREENVPRFLRFPVRGSFFLEYRRYSPDVSFRIIAAPPHYQDKPGERAYFRAAEPRAFLAFFLALRGTRCLFFFCNFPIFLETCAVVFTMVPSVEPMASAAVSKTLFSSFGLGLAFTFGGADSLSLFSSFSL